MMPIEALEESFRKNNFFINSSETQSGTTMGQLLLSATQIADAMAQSVEQVRAAMARAGYLYYKLITSIQFTGMTLDGKFVYNVVCTHDEDDIEEYSIHLKYKVDYLSEKIVLAAVD